MGRTTKKPEERRLELLDAMRRLFLSEGYHSVSVSRIVREVGVAQGTFYYYFPTKEAAFDALVEEALGRLVDEFERIASEPGIGAREALESMVRAEMSFDSGRLRELCGIEGIDVHTRLFARTIAVLAPRYQAVIERGLAAGLFTTPFPDLIAETIILHVHFLFDRDVLGWGADEYGRRLAAAAALIEVLLCLPIGSLNFSAPCPDLEC
jgi:AcrR family transcriptional regulator